MVDWDVLDCVLDCMLLVRDVDVVRMVDAELLDPVLADASVLGIDDAIVVGGMVVVTTTIVDEVTMSDVGMPGPDVEISVGSGPVIGMSVVVPDSNGKAIVTVPRIVVVVTVDSVIGITLTVALMLGALVD